MIGAVGIGFVALVALGVLGQPAQRWTQAAEHSKRFWFVWMLGFVTVGLVPALVVGEVPAGWALVWLLVCCAGAVLQPALYTDLRDVRRTRRLQRDAMNAPQLRVVRPAPAPAAAPARLPEIRWYAPREHPPAYGTADYTRIGTSA